MRDKYAFTAGLVTIIGIAILTLTVIWFGRMSFSNDYREIEILFDDAGGLGAGDEVQLYGFKIGSVKDFDLKGRKVSVICEIANQYTVPKGSQYVIEQSGIIGSKIVKIIPSASELAEDFSVPVEGGKAFTLAATLSKANEIVSNLNDVINLVKGQLTDSTGKNIDEIVTNLHTFSSDLAEISSSNKGDIENLISSLKNTTTKLDKFIERADNKMDAVATGTTTLLSKTGNTAENLDSLIANINEMIDKVNTNDGSLNKIITDKTLHDELTKSLADIQALIADIKKDPKKYFSFSVF